MQDKCTTNAQRKKGNFEEYVVKEMARKETIDHAMVVMQYK